ncbi:MAG: beta-hydroxyacyl-ACP dehydratase [Planctomycetes bacterium]|nr:beta-hydroxyacyl-ACP dehydratase [Planctomycetota bacterium]MBI3844671.1 beta-hydroxyacyl-ACP dehydratase [Planctomycetota bacterium]
MTSAPHLRSRVLAEGTPDHMGQEQIVDLSKLDLEKVELDIEGIRRCIPQRYEMEQLDGIIRYDPVQEFIVGFRDVRNDEFWVRGHIPGRPLLPGVLMLEAAAQLASTYIGLTLKQPGLFIGFGAADRVKFRGTVAPGDRLLIAARCQAMRSRAAVFDVQGLVAGKVVFEARVTGVRV